MHSNRPVFFFANFSKILPTKQVFQRPEAQLFFTVILFLSRCGGLDDVQCLPSSAALSWRRAKARNPINHNRALLKDNHSPYEQERVDEAPAHAT